MIHVVSDAERVATSAARLVDTMLRGRARKTEAGVSLVLSGGSTPRRLYELLNGAAGDDIPWQRITAYWGDERCVREDDPKSNYGMTLRTGLLARPFASVKRMPGEMRPEEGADLYETAIREAFPASGLPRFDLVLLGLGDDGHIASLFPGSDGLVERSRLVLPTELHEGTRRLTLSLPVLAAARSLLFLVSGEGKADAVRGVLRSGLGRLWSRSPARILLDMISVAEMAGWDHPTVTWVIDRRAAAHLRSAHANLDAGTAHR